jgi:hypothetical protein
MFKSPTTPSKVATNQIRRRLQNLPPGTQQEGTQYSENTLQYLPLENRRGIVIKKRTKNRHKTLPACMLALAKPDGELVDQPEEKAVLLM